VARSGFRSSTLEGDLRLPGLFELLLESDHRVARRRGSPWTSGKNRSSITSTMLIVQVDRNESVSLQDQVAAEIRRAIAEREAAPGERLPLAKGGVQPCTGFEISSSIAATRAIAEVIRIIEGLP
jgi:hypothetical protein